MRLLDSKNNVCFGVINPHNSQLVIQKKCSTCENDRFTIKKLLMDCETGSKMLEVICNYCGKIENYSYKEGIFQTTNGDKI